MLVLACGSRGWHDVERIHKTFDDYALDDWTLLHGGARGADTLAGDVARLRGMAVEVIRPNWADGRSAGFARNIAMLDRKPDLVTAFWDGQSRGTAHTMREAKKRGIITVMILDRTAA